MTALERRLSKLEDNMPQATHMLFRDAGETEEQAAVRTFGERPRGALVVIRWAETDAEAFSDPAEAQP